MLASSVSSGELQIWQFRFSDHYRETDRLSHLLSINERDGALRFHNKQDREKYTIGKSLLRIVLASYMQESPQDLRFEQSAYGKPSVINRIGLRFNLSHSNDFLLIAVAVECEIGVDIEFIQNHDLSASILERVYSPNELKGFNLIPSGERLHEFFVTWARKEAYLKGIDKGLSVSPSGFEIVFDAVQQKRLIRFQSTPHQSEAWSLYDLDCTPGYAAAVAAEGDTHQIRLIAPSETGYIPNL